MTGAGEIKWSDAKLGGENSDGISCMVRGKPQRGQQNLQIRLKRGGWFPFPISRANRLGAAVGRRVGQAFSPPAHGGMESWGVAPGWDGAARWALGGWIWDGVCGMAGVLAGALGKRVRTLVTLWRGL